jgi:hypothetical protein
MKTISGRTTRKTVFEGLLRQRIAVQTLLAGSQHAGRPGPRPELSAASFAVPLQRGGNAPQTTAVKTADVMHVAMMEFGFDIFVTSDKQQHDFATRTGMRSVFLPP